MAEHVIIPKRAIDDLVDLAARALEFLEDKDEPSEGFMDALHGSLNEVRVRQSPADFSEVF